MKRIIAIVLVLIISLFVWFFGQKLPDIYAEMGKVDYNSGNYKEAYSDLNFALKLNRKHQDARYYYVQTLLKLKPTFDVQRELYNVSHLDLNDSADLIADRQIAKWKEKILVAVGPNYIERAPVDGKILRWDIKKFPLKVCIQKNSSAAPDYYQEEMKNAFLRWQSVTDNLLRFEFINNEKDANIVITINSSADMKKCAEENCKYSVAYTTPFTNGNLLEKMQIIFYDSNNLAQPFSAKEIYSTALHEIGHALGIMGHSQTKGDLMYMESGPDNTLDRYVGDFQLMTSNDINTINLLYRLVPDVTNTPLREFDTSRQFFYPIILGNEERINSAKVTEAQNYIQSAPDLPNGYMDLAAAYSEAKRYSKAIEPLNKALTLCSNDEERFMVYYNFSVTYMEMKDWQNALSYAKLAKTANPSPSSSSDVDGLIASIYFNSGDKQSAKRIYSEALQSDPTNIINSLNLAIIYIKELNPMMAGKILNNLVAANPDARNDSRVKPFAMIMLIFK